jgi:molybdopterin molybdotransferase
MRVRLEEDRAHRGLWLAHLAGGQGSHVLSALALADGLAIIPEDDAGAEAGTEVEVIRLDIEVA